MITPVCFLASFVAVVGAYNLYLRKFSCPVAATATFASNVMAMCTHATLNCSCGRHRASISEVRGFYCVRNLKDLDSVKAQPRRGISK